jgi:quercetin dioxygenase-like cupin family protein
MVAGLTANEEATPVEMLPGIVRRTLNEGDRTMLCELKLAKGGHVPSHTHPHEQIGYLVSGRFRFRMGDQWQEVLEDSVALDIFSPPREEYRDPGPLGLSRT